MTLAFLAGTTGSAAAILVRILDILIGGNLDPLSAGLLVAAGVVAGQIDWRMVR